MLKIIGLNLLMLFSLAGCGVGQHTEEDNKENDTLQIKNQNNREETGTPYGYNHTSDRDGGLNSASNQDKYSDPHTTDESLLLTEELRKHKDIIQVQVASTQERIIVGVILREAKHTISKEDIEKEIKQILPNINKEIIVYTDDVSWDYYKDQNARPKSNENGKTMEDFGE
ncbi:hypothetical protein D8M04_01470 [Oceanobacillus piezotolerans]|uniref:Sporulation protein n=1 Tax=Oceanobacillus piezotolerans TaxID=2448030 RepID=A0A498DEL1_9BACI|nr:YhcN/YlaJ family sporulation lipoprotein [Oceanobacillus piezotolerans]RLL47975.1 hypothetical protein D8M04_01470 [Oceanobacillus piezotolerans]